MRVPSIQYREPANNAQLQVDSYAAGVLGATVVVGALVWALAIGKLIDFFSSL